MDILAGAIWSRLLDPPALWAIVVFVVAVTAIVAPHWRRARQAGDTTRLIQRMMEKGYKPDEIERILRAGLPDQGELRGGPSKPFVQHRDHTPSGTGD